MLNGQMYCNTHRWTERKASQLSSLAPAQAVGGDLYWTHSLLWLTYSIHWPLWTQNNSADDIYSRAFQSARSIITGRAQAGHAVNSTLPQSM